MRRPALPVLLVLLASAAAATAQGEPSEPALPDLSTPVLVAQAAPADPNAAPPPTSKPPRANRVWFGGSIGLSFGDVETWQIAPVIGFKLTPKFDTGVELFYLHRDDKRFDPDISTDDYGARAFAIYRPFRAFFLEAMYDYTKFEYGLANGETEDDSHSGFLLGAGVVQPMGGNASFLMSALYDLTYDEDEPYPYDSPWRVTAGVVFGF